MNSTGETTQSIPARFTQIAARHASRTAIRAHGGQWTYAELDGRSTFIAGEILNRLGETSEPVALLMEHDAPLIAAILGVLKANKIYLALDPAHSSERLAALLADSQTRLLLTDKTNAARARSFWDDKLQILEITNRLAASSPRADLPQISPESGAWIMFTSGSTGAPRGIWQNHSGVINHTDVYSDLIQLSPDDRLSLLTSCSLAASATPLFAALLNGATLCPFPVRAQGVERLAGWLHAQRISVYHSVATIFRHLAPAAAEKKSFADARIIRLGGEPLFRSDVELFRRLCPDTCRLMHSLSSTETGLIAAFMIDKQTPLPERRVPVGRAVRGVEVLLLDEEGQPVKNGGEGRIAVRSTHLRQGYWRQPFATAETFKIDAQNPRLRTFISNDLGRFLPDNSLEHLGRADQVVKIRGFRVELGAVEGALREIESVQETAVTTHEDASGERRLAAYIVPRAGAAVSSRNLRRELRGQLPEYMVPTDFVMLERLPQTSGGKLDRRALPSPQHPAKPVTVRRHRPRYSIEKKLAKIWEVVLNLPRVGRQDDFFDLGGTSLQSAQVLTQIEDAFNVILPPSTLAEHSTIEALAILLADRTIIPSDSPLVVLRGATAGRPLFFVHNGTGSVSTYGQLARRLPNRPIYGLQARGLRGESWPITSIPGMARYYLPKVIAADPTGPYLLAGTCMGAMVAFEMAQQLIQSARPVGLVALFDSPTPPFSGRRSHWHEMFMDPLRDFFRMARWRLIRAPGFGRSARGLPAWRHFVSGMNGRAWHLYRPGVYPGKLTLFHTAAPYAKEDRRSMMIRHAREAQIIIIPGTWAGLFVPPAVDELARQLQICLDHAEGRRPS